MRQILITGVFSGMLLILFDGIINGNSFARKILSVYNPIARESIRILPAILINFMYGFFFAFLYFNTVSFLPGNHFLLKGLCFGILIWTLRVLMPSLSHWIMFKIPIKTIIYTSVTGLFEMVVTGIFYGFSAKLLK